MKKSCVFLLFIFLSFLFKSVGFGQSSYDWDESTYLIIGNLWLNGGEIYKDFIDTKPVGIFIISALCNLLSVEYAIIAFRLLGALFVSVGGFFSYLIFRTISIKHKIAIAGGIIFIGMFYFISSLGAWKIGFGLESNTEHFFVPLIPVSIFPLLINKRYSLILSGFVLGLAFMIKYFVIIDALIILILIILSTFNKKQSLVKNLLFGLKKCMIWGISFSTPFLIALLIFYTSESWEDFHFITFSVWRNYSSDPEISQIMNFVKRIIFLFPVFLILILFNFFNTKRKHEIFFQVGIVWLFVDLIFITMAGKLFSHYYYQLIPVLCLLTTISIDNLSEKYLKISHFTLFALAVISFVFRINIELGRIDFPKKITSYILNIDKNPTIYCVNFQHIIYLLSDTKPPTKYIHPDLIYNSEFTSALGLDTNLEINKILSKSPKWIVIKDHFPLLSKELQQNYTLKKTFGENIHLFLKE